MPSVSLATFRISRNEIKSSRPERLLLSFVSNTTERKICVNLSTCGQILQLRLNLIEIVLCVLD